MLGVNGQRTMKSKKGSAGKRRAAEKNDMKVVYISNPMKVNTSASEFRAIVQELTGRDSDVARFMEANESETGGLNCNMNKVSPDADERVIMGRNDCMYESRNYYPFENHSSDSQSANESDFLFDPVDPDMLSAETVERSFVEFFPFGFQESTLLDVLN